MMLAMEELQPVQAAPEGRESPYLIPIAIIIAGLVIGAAVYFSRPSPAPAGPKAGQSSPSNKLITLDVDVRPVLGNPTAEIAIVEFSDFQCPYCGRFFTQTLPSLTDQYIKTGKIKLIYRDFPLTAIGHQYAQKAAEAALCANDQNKFWQMHDKIFGNQADLSVNNLKKLAADLVSADDFNTCLDSNKYEKAVLDDFDFSASLGVEGTPTFFVGRLPMQVKSLDKFQSGPNDRGDYKVLVGALPFSEFEKAINAVLNK